MRQSPALQKQMETKGPRAEQRPGGALGQIPELQSRLGECFPLGVWSLPVML